MADAPLSATRPDAAPIGGSYTPPTAPAPDASLERALRDEPTAFSFFQAVRLLSRLRPDRAPVGGWADPASEPLRFSASTSLGFPASEIQSLTLPGDDGPPGRMTVNFMGLTGPQGVLPHFYTEHTAALARARDTALRDFLDLFNHRVLSLFYRAWKSHRSPVLQEEGAEDRIHEHLLDLSGLGTAGLRGRLPIPDAVLAFYAGLLASRVRPADGLARLISDYFDVPAEVEQFVGEWRRVDERGQLTMGADDDAGRLGFGVLGNAAWDAQARVRLRLGPLTRAQYDAFLPGGSAYAALSALTRLYAGDEVGVDAQLVLARGEVPACVLGPAARDGPAPPRLGRGTWLAARPLERDPDETMLRLS
ncbi:MAG TPA: type VI secretion system baseplate subunit TssG [Gemmatimonadaceae bacterium]|jgi:type VI secretion system protein ImpH|nr:type VI secretion system baseplate subunit TssG [Gemmatimonadaceae bacterium]